MRRTILLCLFLGFFCYQIKAQLSTEEIPYSWGRYKNDIARQSIPVQTLQSFDRASIDREDSVNNGNTAPFRFGYPHEVNLSLYNSGTWQTTSDSGRLWTLRIYSQDALSLNLLYDKFWLPEGAKFFIYSTDKQQYIGAFTSQNNKGDKDNNLGFATSLLFTNDIVLEYYEPKGINDTGIISVSHIVSGYRYIFDIVKSRDGELLSCHNDINCIEGANWRQEKNAVAYVIMGWYGGGSGALLNTTANDNTPIFLSAYHCFNLSASTTQWIFYWNYESTTCDGEATIDNNKTTIGADLLAMRENTDFMLLKLIEDPAKNRNITTYYLGWDRSASSASSGVCIHHPKGAQKKISKTDNAIINFSSTFCFNLDNCVRPNTHWQVLFTNGTTESGSSGSPLLNQDRRVIGQLRGGYGDCPPNVTKYFGRFDLSWDGNDSSVRLRDWLDPNNTTVVLDGTACNPINFTNQSVSTDNTIINCNNINVKNVKIKDGATLILDADGDVTIESDFEVELGSELEIK